MGSPATHSTHVGEALRKSDIRFVHVRHEEVGGFAVRVVVTSLSLVS
ncbi:MAG: hypothetical protein QOJ17_1660 [Rhodospirillaceae bacterium]|jgi:thiamine pyrophosphate-dependent acetolactate synthase large subunit-like protein|nr:hypothetical protein [Rhodospirillaceae bacterium]